MGRISAIHLHRIRQILNRFELVGGDISGRGVDEAGQAVDDRCAGVFDRGGLDDAERGIRLAGNHPVAQVAVLGAVNLADGFLLDGDALHGLDRDDGAHADAAPGLDDLTEGGGADVVVDDAGNMLLRDGLNRQAVEAGRLRKSMALSSN